MPRGQRQSISAAAGSSIEGASPVTAVPQDWLDYAAGSSRRLAAGDMQEAEDWQPQDVQWQQQHQQHWHCTSPPHQQAYAARAAPAALHHASACFAAWQQQASERAAAAALAEQQWSAYHGWRLLARGFRAWRDEAQQCSAVQWVVEGQAREHAQLQRLRRAFRAWRFRYTHCMWLPAEQLSMEHPLLGLLFASELCSRHKQDY